MLEDSTEHLGLGQSETLALQDVTEQVGEEYRCNPHTSEMEAKQPEAAKEVVRRLVAARQIGAATMYLSALSNEPRTQEAAQMAMAALGVAPSIRSASTPPPPVVAPNALQLAKNNHIVEETVLEKDLDGHSWHVIRNFVEHLGETSSRFLAAFLAESGEGDESDEQLELQNWKFVVPSVLALLPQLQDKLERNVVMHRAFDYNPSNYLMCYDEDFKMLKWGTTTVGLKRLWEHASKLSRLRKRLPLLLLWLPGEIGTSGTCTEGRMRKFLTDHRDGARAARLRLLGFEAPVGILHAGDLGESGENLLLDPSVNLIKLCQSFQTEMAWSRRAGAAVAAAGYVPSSPLAEALAEMENLTD